jgi:hypothetical protein
MSRIAPFRTVLFPIATQERHTCIKGIIVCEKCPDASVIHSESIGGSLAFIIIRK